MMPTPSDIKSEELDQPDPDDQLRMMLDQGQGNNLAGAPMPPGQTGMAGAPGGPPASGGPPPSGMPQPIAPSPNVPGPLSALAQKGKPHIKLKTPPPRAKPHIKLKTKPKVKPHIKLKAFANV